MMTWILESMTVGRCERNYLHDLTVTALLLGGLLIVVVFVAGLSIWREGRRPR